MAPKKKKVPADKGADKGGDEPEEESTGKVTNLTALRAELDEMIKAWDAKTDSREAFNGEISLDIANIKEKFANKTGYTRAQLQEVYTEHRRALKKEQKRKEREAAENDAIDALMAALEGMKGTPLYRAAMEAAKG